MTCSVAVTGIGCLAPWSDPPSSFAEDSPIGDGQLRLLPKSIKVPGFNDRTLMRCDRISLMVAAGFSRCQADMQPVRLDVDPTRTGILCGSAFGSLEITGELLCGLHREGVLGLDPIKFPMESHNYPLSFTAVQHGLKGPIASIIGFSSASLAALQLGRWLVCQGQADRLFIVGVEEIGPILQRYVNSQSHPKMRLSALRQKNGPYLSEGCTVVCLEKLSAAGTCGTDIYGKISGVAAGNNPWGRMDQRSITNVARRAIKTAHLTPDDIDVVALNGSGSSNDREAEKAAMRTVFGKRARGLRSVPIKRKIGNHLGASGISELAYLLTLEKWSGGEGDLKAGGKHHRASGDLRYALLINFGLGSQISACVVERGGRRCPKK